MPKPPSKSETARAHARAREDAKGKPGAPPKAKRAPAPPGVVEQSYELAPINAIAPHPANPNEGDAEAIEESVDENGFYGACIVQRSSGHILVGNHRWAAAKKIGVATIPVIYLDIDDAHALKILLADNATRRRATTHAERVAAVLKKLPSLRGTGYKAPDLQALVRRVRPKADADERDPSRPPRAPDERAAGVGDGGAPGKPADEDERAPRKGRFPLAIILSSPDMVRWCTFKKRVGQSDDKTAFLELLAAAEK